MADAKKNTKKTNKNTEATSPNRTSGKITIYLTRDSFCMGDDAMAPNIRRFTCHIGSDWCPECKIYDILDSYFGTNLPGYFWRGYAGGEWFADMYLLRKDGCGFLKDCNIAENWEELLEKYGTIHFIHTDYEERDKLPMKRKNEYTFKQAERIYKQFHPEK
ncbi:MAG: hypothetical protein J6O73_11240 [Lachnospiraceae bacterium]|nr:hypothetical protein [Lachnospiraceae bacterium]